jgi:hypothetical protein
MAAAGSCGSRVQWRARFNTIARMKKFLLTAIALIAVTATAVYAYRDSLFVVVMGMMMGPDVTFAQSPVPAPPDYRQLSSWAAHPDLDDAADEHPPGIAVAEPTGERPVAVFFVHPTSFMSSAAWNQPLDDPIANSIVDERILRHQASVFNGCCAIWAPRYRQATFFSFIDTSGDGEKALSLAYGDVARAFDAFLAGLKPHQPFILAGHSQGTRHAARLLREEIGPTALLERMVAAYLVGFSISRGDIGGVPVCDRAVQTGCAVGWNAMDGEGAGVFGGIDDLLCTNPLSWRTDTEYAGHDLNRGAIGFASWRPAPDEDPALTVPEAGAADAQCVKGQLAVMELRSEAFPSRMGGNSLHPYDYSLFHMNIRENAGLRVRAFLASAEAGTVGDAD